MSFSGIETTEALAKNLAITEDALIADLIDRRTIAVPLAWFPRLMHGSTAERADWRWIGSGSGVHLPALDEDISIASLLGGRKSGETQESLRRWLSSRQIAR